MPNLYPEKVPTIEVMIARFFVMERCAPHLREKNRIRGSTPASIIIKPKKMAMVL